MALMLTLSWWLFRHIFLIFVSCFQARLVATAVNSLCEAANATVQGNATQETLIASAQQVSNSTAQLLLACRVKADPNSAGQQRLQVIFVLTMFSRIAES